VVICIKQFYLSPIEVGSRDGYDIFSHFCSIIYEKNLNWEL